MLIRGTLMLVRGKYAIVKPGEGGQNGVLVDGAVLVRNGTIQDVETFDLLKNRYPDEQIIGSDRYIVSPGLSTPTITGGGSERRLGSALDIGQYQIDLACAFLQVPKGDRVIYRIAPQLVISKQGGRDGKCNSKHSRETRRRSGPGQRPGKDR